ncbi:MAG: phosphotyrosine protein phosphatase [Fusicatenibacter sp.]|nr:phosphotyrosine protein phosphatase [Lachnospiraceae bacterium]MDY2936830.1 phosphotyrosine protein phosphatase [Fusicatenibacter sp.]
MKPYDRIIFVDADDTSRAPMAKAIMQKKEFPWPMEILSRGLVVLFPQPVNQKVEAVLVRNGCTAKEYVTVPLKAEDINERTLILTMEESQRIRILEQYGEVPHLATIAGYLHINGDIPALYGEPLPEYGKCYEVLDALISMLIEQLTEEAKEEKE